MSLSWQYTEPFPSNKLVKRNHVNHLLKKRNILELQWESKRPEVIKFS